LFIQSQKLLRLENKEKFRYTLKFYYKKGKNAQIAKKIRDVYGHAVSVLVAHS